MATTKVPDSIISPNKRILLQNISRDDPFSSINNIGSAIQTEFVTTVKALNRSSSCKSPYLTKNCSIITQSKCKLLASSPQNVLIKNHRKKVDEQKESVSAPKPSTAPCCRGRINLKTINDNSYLKQMSIVPKKNQFLQAQQVLLSTPASPTKLNCFQGEKIESLQNTMRKNERQKSADSIKLQKLVHELHKFLQNSISLKKDLDSCEFDEALQLIDKLILEYKHGKDVQRSWFYKSLKKRILGDNCMRMFSKYIETQEYDEACKLFKHAVRYYKALWKLKTSKYCDRYYLEMHDEADKKRFMIIRHKAINIVKSLACKTSRKALEMSHNLAVNSKSQRELKQAYMLLAVSFNAFEWLGESKKILTVLHNHINDSCDVVVSREFQKQKKEHELNDEKFENAKKLKETRRPTFKVQVTAFLAMCRKAEHLRSYNNSVAHGALEEKTFLEVRAKASVSQVKRKQDKTVRSRLEMKKKNAEKKQLKLIKEVKEQRLLENSKRMFDLFKKGRAEELEMEEKLYLNAIKHQEDLERYAEEDGSIFSKSQHECHLMDEEHDYAVYAEEWDIERKKLIYSFSKRIVTNITMGCVKRILNSIPKPLLDQSLHNEKVKEFDKRNIEILQCFQDEDMRLKLELKMQKAKLLNDIQICREKFIIKRDMEMNDMRGLLEDLHEGRFTMLNEEGSIYEKIL